MITAIVEEMFAANPDDEGSREFCGGNNKLQDFFVSQLMTKAGGKVDPRLANQIF